MSPRRWFHPFPDLQPGRPRRGYRWPPRTAACHQQHRVLDSAWVIARPGRTASGPVDSKDGLPEGEFHERGRSGVFAEHATEEASHYCWHWPDAGCGGRGSADSIVTWRRTSRCHLDRSCRKGADGASRQSNIDKNGNFLVEYSAIGDAKVAVMISNPKSITVLTKGERNPKLFREVPNWMASPAKYETIAKSGLPLPDQER